MRMWKRGVAGALAFGGLMVTQGLASADQLRAPELVQVQPFSGVGGGSLAPNCDLRRYGHPPYGRYGYGFYRPWHRRYYY